MVCLDALVDGDCGWCVWMGLWMVSLDELVDGLEVGDCGWYVGMGVWMGLWAVCLDGLVVWRVDGLGGNAAVRR